MLERKREREKKKFSILKHIAVEINQANIKFKIFYLNCKTCTHSVCTMRNAEIYCDVCAAHWFALVWFESHFCFSLFFSALRLPCSTVVSTIINSINFIKTKFQSEVKTRPKYGIKVQTNPCNTIKND